MHSFDFKITTKERIKGNPVYFTIKYMPNRHMNLNKHVMLDMFWSIYSAHYEIAHKNFVVHYRDLKPRTRKNVLVPL